MEQVFEKSMLMTAEGNCNAAQLQAELLRDTGILRIFEKIQRRRKHQLEQDNLTEVQNFFEKVNFEKSIFPLNLSIFFV